MKNKLPKYDKYKPSGVEWLGEIPEHWDGLYNKYIFKLKKNLVGKKSHLYDLLSLTLLGVIKRDMENPQGKFPAEFDTYQEVKKGDFIFCLFDVEETPRTVGLSEFDGMITGAYTVFEVNKDFDRRFLYYFYLNLDNGKRMKPLYTGLRNTISKDNFFSFRTLFPPLTEQTRIAEFLDRKTAQIDQAIGIKEKQIALLKERRQIMIHRAVTRGVSGLNWDSSDLGISGLASESNIPKSANQVNPDSDIYHRNQPKLKPSGVEWIGDIPEHWEVKKLRYVGKCQNGISKGGEYFGSGYPFVSYSDVYKNIELPKTVNGLAESTEADRKQYSVEEGDIFFTRTSETVEEIAFASTCSETIENATFAGFLIRFRPQKNILFKGFSKFYFSSQTHRAFFVKEMNLVIRASLSQELLNRMPILVPPIQEQIVIASHIEVLSSKIATAISLKEQEIAKLKEYKSVLINSAVTGKVKVV